jgi:DNA-directed RNA polymerase specialized sigma24 family protein
MGRPLSIAAPEIDDASPAQFEELFREQYQLLYHTAFAVTGNRHDADDVLQSLFVMLLQGGISPELKSNPAGWLHRAVVNLSLTIVRVRPRARGEGHAQSTIVIARLKARALEILLLRYKHGYSDSQIAALLGTSRSTIAVTLSRLRARLRKSFRLGGRDQGTTEESLREQIDRCVPSPSHIETAASRDWILERVRSLPARLSHAQMAEIASVVSWWRSARRL